MDIRHVVVLIVETRSFDCMLGRLYPKSAEFDGLAGDETNIWHRPDGEPQTIAVWNDPTATAQALTIPDPDPGELFADIHLQIYGLAETGAPKPGPAARRSATQPRRNGGGPASRRRRYRCACRTAEESTGPAPVHLTGAAAALDARAHVKAFLGR
jgi:hypothetical protein